MRYLIVGGGAAAVNAAKAIRNQDTEGTIQLCCKENALPYNRVKLSKELFSNLRSEEILIKKEQWYQSSKIQVLTDTIIASIDTEGHKVVTGKGEQIPYDKLLICTGSNNRKLTIEGAELKGVFTIREMQEAEEFKAYIQDKTEIVIIGGGIQGLETAWALINAGKKVTIVEACPTLMGRQLDEKSSKLLKKKIEATGTKVILNATIEQFVGEEQVTGLKIQGTDIISCDSVLYSIGVNPNIELTNSTLIKTNRGILINDYMETSVKDIYAAGDVAEVSGEVVASWSAAMEQGTIAGLNMVDANKEYKKTLLVTIFNAFDLELFSIGFVDESKCDTSITEDDEKEKYTKLFIKDGKIVGVISTGSTSEAVPYLQLIKKGTPMEGIHLEGIGIRQLIDILKERG